MATTVAQDSPLALELQNLVQPKLVEAGWSAGDSTLAEYIVLMLVNGKNKEQVASELSNDLLGLGPDDPSAKEFSQWLFDQVSILSGQAAKAQLPAPHTEFQSQPQPIPSAPTGPSANTDADMEATMDVEQNQSIPTGPKSMRNGSAPQRGGTGRRILGQMNKALDRTNDSLLHKVRNTSMERIGRPTRGSRGGMQHGAQFKGVPSGPGGRGSGNMTSISSQQQNQLMQFIGQQMEMMQQMMGGQTPAIMSPMGGAAVNPNFRGRPMAERINARGRGGGGKFGDRRGIQNGGVTTSGGDTEMAGEGPMETDSVTTGSGAPNPETTVCKFNLKCSKPDCPFAHSSPAAPPGTTIDTSDVCSFGAACQNRKCVGRHPSPAKRQAYHAEQECKFWPNCTNPHCTFRHPERPMCRFGGDCTKEDCKFTHVRTSCKYNPCMNPNCYFKHAEGQKKGSKWTRDGAGDTAMSGGEHVSERKFTSDGNGEEELIRPGQESGQAQTEDLVT